MQGHFGPGHDVPVRILIVRLSHLGDVVQTLPVLDAVRRAHPRAKIAWAVQPEFADLLRGHPSLDTIVLFDRRGGLSAWVRLERDLARFAADWSIDAQGNTKSALVALASRAPRRTGLARADWTEPFGAHSLTDAAEPAPAPRNGSVHAMDRMSALARHVAPTIQFDALRSSSFLAHDELDLDACFADRFGSARGPFALVHLSTPGDVRSWPLAHYAALARNLAQDHDVLLVSGPQEREIGLELERALSGTSRIRHWTAQSGLRAFAAFLRAAARRDAVCIACDSGPLHMAWAAGMRVVLLAGPQAADRTGPWPPIARGGAPSSRHRVVRAMSPPACAPCFARTCSHAAGNVCMTRIEPEDVARTVRSLTRSGASVGERGADDAGAREPAIRGSIVTNPGRAPVSAP